MIRSEVRAHVAANEPVSAAGAGGPDDQATKGAAASPPLADRPKLAPDRPRPPWLVRNSRKAMIALMLSILAASPFAYLYVQRNFGPDPLAGIKIDGVKFDPVTAIFDVARPVEVKAVNVKPAMEKPIAAAKPAEQAPKPVSPQSSVSPAAPFAAAPVAPSFGVTHTRSAVAASARPETVPPVGAIPDARAVTVQPRAGAREPQAVSGACTEAVAALGLCDRNATTKDK
jgi:hypothetical protein